MVTGLGAGQTGDWGSISDSGMRVPFIFHSVCVDQLWDPLSLLSSL